MPVDTSMYGNILVPKPMEQMGQAIGVAQGMQNLQESQFNLHMKQLDNARMRLGTLAAKPDLSQKDVLDNISDMVAAGDMTPSQAAIMSKSVSQKDPMAFVRMQLLNTLGAQEKLNAIHPMPRLEDYGSGVAPVTLGQVPGTPSYGMGVAPSRVPGEIAGPGGMGITKTLPPQVLETVTPEGGREIKTPAELGLGQPRNVLTEKPAVTPNLLQPKMEPGPGSAKGAKPESIGATPSRATKLGTGEEEFMKASGENLVQDMAMAGNRAAELNPLEEAIPLLQKLGPTGSGPGSAQFAVAANTLKTLGLAPEKLVDKATMLNEVDKYLAQNANTMNERTTDFKLARDILGAPNTQMANKAAEILGLRQLALKRQNIAAATAFAESGKPKGSYNAWKAKWTAGQDLDGYVLDMMSPAGQEEKLKRLETLPTSHPAYKKFMAAHKAAEDAQLLKPFTP